MSDSESHQMDEQPIVYEEEEVLWAKIRGYPWWPAFVDKVHGANSDPDEQIEYTVFFFGDNTHSRLGASKLRRFLDYYTEFFPKAKTNRKLYLSIMKAEEKLKQNGGNVEIFQTLRNSLKKNKKLKGHKTESRIDSEDHVHNLSEQPELVRNKTFPNHQQKSGNEIVSEQQQLLLQEKQAKRKGRKPRKAPSIDQKQQVQKKQPNSESQSDEEEKEIQEPKVLNYRTRSGRARNQPPKIQQSKHEKSEPEKESSQESPDQDNNKKNQASRFVPKTKQISRNAPKKRGRPKKVVEEPQESSSQQSHEEQSNKSQNNNNNSNKIPAPPLSRATSEVRKTRLQRKLEPRQSVQQVKRLQQKQKIIQETTQKCETSQQTKQLIIERVKFCLDKRNQLIEYLDELNVTTEFVKEILDLDVTTVILEGGEMTQEAIKVLQKLKSVLLHKYFPDDIKIRKKYEKLTKKTQSLRTSTPQNEESLEDLQLRRKTLIKLEKILRSIEDASDQKQKAIEIESYFRKYDESIGTGYKTIAYRVLRSLKDKNHSVEEIMGKLEAGDFDEQSK